MAGLACFLLRTIRLGAGRSRSLIVIFIEDGRERPFVYFSKTDVNVF